MGSGQCEIASGFIHHSSFIIHHSFRHLPSATYHLPSTALPDHATHGARSRLNAVPCPLSPGPFHRGVTLVEMLIVISIIMILLAITLRAIPKTEDRRVREAARAVNVYLSSARNRAMEIGRPCGVIFHRATGTNFSTVSMILDQCEVPPPYAGDTMNAAVQVQNWTYKTDGTPYWIDPDTGRMKYVLKIRIQLPVNIADNLIRTGDLIQLNNQGPYFALEWDIKSPTTPDFPLDTTYNIFYSFAGGTGSGAWVDNCYLTATLDPQEMPMQALPWPTQASGNWSAALSFNILRQPDKVKSSASTLQLPAGAVVDLHYSGPDGSSFGNTGDVTIIFSSNGAVEGYYFNGKHTVAGPIFLLIGQTKLIDPISGTDSNGTDLSNMWITINPQTGLVSTDEMAAGSDPLQYARESQSMGGR